MKPVLLIRNCAVESGGIIGSYFKTRHIPWQTIHTYRGESLPLASETAAVINLGTPISANDYPQFDYLRALFEAIAQTVRDDHPYLGICFGAQILAKVLGAQVMRNPVKEIGICPVRLTEAGRSDPLFAGFAGEFEVFQWHADTFRLPFGSQLLAEGNNCRNQAFRKGKAVGLQFHLEVDCEEVPRWCQAYADELAEVGKTETDIVAGCRKEGNRIKQLGYRLLDNFFASI
jgi:GMP synthase-like glutamine amidotransferase